MIKFFRKYRQKTLAENKLGKYLIYAIGEIVLVVIGIIIALQINNWNQNKISIEKTELLLSQARTELALNITKSNSVINSYRIKNTDAYSVINKEATRDDYASNFKLSLLLQSAAISDLTNDAFINLIDNKGDLSKEQDSIILELSKLYNDEKKSVDLIEKKVISDLFDFVKEITSEKAWYGDCIHSLKLSEEAIQYFLNDPFYYNKVINFQTINLGNHLSSTLQFRNRGLQIYSTISEHLQLPEDTLIVQDLSKFEHFLGSYSNKILKGFDVLIEKDMNQFVLLVKDKSDSTVIQSTELYPYSESTFMLGNQFGTLFFDDNKKVSRLTLEIGDKKQELKRINL